MYRSDRGGGGGGGEVAGAGGAGAFNENNHLKSFRKYSPYLVN